MHTHADVAALLGETGWVRTLARRLAADAHLGDDLAQEAWLTALERPPSTDRSVRAWFATVLRHGLSDVARERARRAERERAVARPEPLPSAHDLVERAATQRALVEAVLELDEPYRTTVLLRFFEELPQREIARRMQTSTATVNSRLTRALDKLRERLSRGGDRAAWLQVLVPLLRGSARVPVPAAALGVSAMKSLVIAVVLASVVVGIALWRAPRSASETASRSTELASHSPDSNADDRGAAPLSQPLVERVERTAATTAEAAPPAPSVETSAPPRVVRGRVIDASGVGVAGVGLKLASAPANAAAANASANAAVDSASTATNARAVSGGGGWFEIAFDAPVEKIVTDDPRFETVLAGSARVHERTEPIVVIAPRIRIAGRVTDEERAPLAGVWVSVRLPANFGAAWQVVLDYSVRERWIVRTGADGRFELPSVPSIGGAMLCAAIGGYAPHSEPEPPGTALAVEIVLERPTSGAGIVRGLVLDPAGSPIERAYVSAGAESSLTDRDGEFALDVAPKSSRPKILAAYRGLLPAVFEPERRADGTPSWPDFVVLELAGPAGAIRGRVVDRSGRGIANARVWIDDPTYFGEIDGVHVVTETLAGGNEEFWSFAVTRADGSFDLGGMLDRAYRIEAVDPATLASAAVDSVRAGADLELVLPTDDVHERVAGRVVSKHGVPLEGILVRLYWTAYELEHANGTDNDGVEGPTARTAADGSFSFARVPKKAILLVASGDAIMATGGDLAGFEDLSHIELRASLRLHVQVALDEPVGRADAVAILGEGGKQAYASVVRDGGSHVMHRFPLEDGRSEVLAVEEGAEVLVLYLGEAEVARIPLHLARGEIEVVRY